MSIEQCHRINTPSVIYDRAVGQTVVINLLTGHYFRLDEASSMLWERLETAPTAAALMASCTNPDDLAARLPAILNELQDHGLVAAVTDGTIPTDQPPASWTFAGFTLESFTDLEDILGLDPIHEADPTAGWPQARAA